ncbi:MAG: sortase domain-containing protein [Nocardioides sp.]
MPAALRLLASATLVLAALAGCAAVAPRAAESPRQPEAVAPRAAPAAQVVRPAPTPLERAGPRPSDGRPLRSALSIPGLGIRDLAVVPYRGYTDDAPGTEIQNGGLAASPHGPRGGVGPGGIGNYQVTAHRTSSTRAFELLPDLRVGERVVVEAAGRRFVYEIRSTRRTSFRSVRSLAEQRAAVPGQPGRTPTRAMITLSTCATQEDHAVGNYWSDEFDNPEHRIDKIGVRVHSTRR